MKITVDNKPGSDKLTETTVTLSVPKCSKDDTGEYTLKLKNKYGEAESNVSSSALRENNYLNQKKKKKTET